jgi:FixJ family two-component response regulator
MDKLITIIEDEPHIGENYRDAFTKRGFKVSLYSDKETALRAMPPAGERGPAVPECAPARHRTHLSAGPRQWSE